GGPQIGRDRRTPPGTGSVQATAALDTTTRQLDLAADDGLATEQQPGSAPIGAYTGRSVSLSDTVGFIRDLPHGLIDAFQATLQEAVDADLLLHVVDAANPNYPEQLAEVQRVLAEIGAEGIPQILVFNKLDAVDESRRPPVLHDLYELDGFETPRVFVSARSGEGLPVLRQMLTSRVHALARQAEAERLDAFVRGQAAEAALG
ncbi:50S ribosome-binding GTPase, partial [Leptospira sp. 96542]|nr:50S ribosome-binding GTPase [Leptospira sp. 96542]